MNSKLGYTNLDIAEIIGHQADRYKTATQPKTEFPQLLKLAIIFPERNYTKDAVIGTLKNTGKEDIFIFIRSKLSFCVSLLKQFRSIAEELLRKQHHRFDILGYDNANRGAWTNFNQAISNEFADLGIYDYTYYLSLDLYKGTSTFYFKDFKSGDSEEFEKTIFSNKSTRRR